MQTLNFRKTIAASIALAVLCAGVPLPSPAGIAPRQPRYRVLAPITHGNLTIFPVATSAPVDTRGFITLDEGLRSGEVVVTESGGVQPLQRPRVRRPAVRRDGAQVNELVLENNSKRPLILLAGEIVTGGKQDRIVGKDRIVPAESDAALSVFCVEPGRWTQRTEKFAASAAPQMATPKLRKEAMDAKDQSAVWAAVRESNAKIAAAPPASSSSGSGRGDSLTLSAGAAGAIASTSSYAQVMNNEEVRKGIDAVAAPMEHSYESIVRELRSQSAVGVVVAINGEIVWADIFASTALLEKYWPKLIRSYAAEAITDYRKSRAPDEHDAMAFLNDMEGTREVVESEPGIYRHSEVSGSGFKLFELASLLPGTGFDIHISKMRTA